MKIVFRKVNPIFGGPGSADLKWLEARDDETDPVVQERYYPSSPPLNINL